MSGVQFETLVAPVCATVRDPRIENGLDQDTKNENLGPDRNIRTDSDRLFSVPGSPWIPVRQKNQKLDHLLLIITFAETKVEIESTQHMMKMLQFMQK